MRRIYALYLCGPERDARCGRQLSGALSGPSPVAKLKTGELNRSGLGGRQKEWADDRAGHILPQVLGFEALEAVLVVAETP